MLACIPGGLVLLKNKTAVICTAAIKKLTYARKMRGKDEHDLLVQDWSAL